MKCSLVLAAFLCVVSLSLAYAQEAQDTSGAGQTSDQMQAPDLGNAVPPRASVPLAVGAPKVKPMQPNEVPPYSLPKPTSYNRTGRLDRPVDPVIGYRNAENVVFLEISPDDLPGFVRADVDKVMSSCPGAAGSISGIKAYSYVSDWIRSRGLSPNYVVDFSGLAADPQISCKSGPTCNDEGCLLVSYNSYSYQQWKQDAVLRNKGWLLGVVNDMRASGVPQSGKATPVAVFDISTKCQGKDAAVGDLCHSYRMWTIGGLGNYTPPSAQ